MQASTLSAAYVTQPTNMHTYGGLAQLDVGYLTVPASSLALGRYLFLVLLGLMEKNSVNPDQGLVSRSGA